jgi:hypothetical protein
MSVISSAALILEAGKLGWNEARFSGYEGNQSVAIPSGTSGKYRMGFHSE